MPKTPSTVSRPADKNAVSMELVWFGDRPAYQRPHYNDIAMQAYWQASKDRGHRRREGRS